MKKKLSRIMACLMACVIAFNVLAIPKVKAVGPEVVGTAALASSTLAAYMTATGVPLTVISGGAGAASAGAASVISGYAAATGGTYSVVTTAIASGVTIGTGGAIVIGAAAAAILAGIVAWMINEYSLEPDIPQGLPVSTHGLYLSDGTAVRFPYVGTVPKPMTQEFANAVLAESPTIFDTNEEYNFQNGLNISKLYAVDTYYHVDFTFPDSEPVGHGITTNWNGRPDYYFWCLADNGLHVFTLTRQGNGFLFECNYRYDWEPFGLTDPALNSVDVTQTPDYAALPELAPLEVIEIAPDLPSEIAPEAVPDAIFEKIANNDFEPTYKVTVPPGDSDSDPDVEPDPDPNPNPDPDGGSDSDTGLDSGESIGWLKRIALACEALADKILGGIESIFAPDPALMQEISEAFTEKFGFVSTLHNLGTDLLSINASSAPPVVYIHLEDAEGSINYGGTVKALDMSWYARYKPDVDRIMSGFLWIGFLWLLFKRASAIINGAEMATDYGTDIHDGFRIRGERNGKRF